MTVGLLFLVLAATFLVLADPGLLGAALGPSLPSTPPSVQWQTPLPAVIPPWLSDAGADVRWYSGFANRRTLVAAQDQKRVWAGWFDAAGYALAAWEGENVAALLVQGADLMVAHQDEQGELGLHRLTPHNLPRGQQLSQPHLAGSLLTALPAGGVAMVAGGALAAGEGTGETFWREWTMVWPGQALAAAGAADATGGADENIPDSDGEPYQRFAADSPILAQAAGSGRGPGVPDQPWGQAAPAGALAQVSIPLTATPAWDLTVFALAADLPILWQYRGDGAPWRPWWVVGGNQVWADRQGHLALLTARGQRWSTPMPGPVQGVTPLDPWGRRVVVSFVEGGWAIYHTGGTQLATGDAAAAPLVWPWPTRGFFVQKGHELTVHDRNGQPRWSLSAGTPLTVTATADALVVVDEDMIYCYWWP